VSFTTNTTNRALTVSAVQWRPGEHSDNNLRDIARLVQTAASHGSTLVVFPEYAHRHLVTPDPSWTAASETLDGPFVTGLQRIAADHQVTIIAGVIETSATGKPYNTQVVVGPTGVIATARKIHLYDAFSMTESDLFTPAPPSPPAVFSHVGMTVGVQTCYDLRFPEVTRHLVDAGAEVVVVPAQWVPGPHKLNQWVTLATARAIEAQVWVVAADHPAPTGVGASLIISPRGEIVQQAGSSGTLLHQVLDGDLVTEVRDQNPMARARRFQVTWG
jgi:deaminated glutathione amidase